LLLSLDLLDLSEESELLSVLAEDSALALDLYSELR